MGLQERNEELYRREYGERTEDFRTPYDPESVDATSPVRFGEEPWTASEPSAKVPVRYRVSRFLSRHRKGLLYGIVGFLTLGSLVVALSFRSFLFAEERVTVVLSGPTDVASAESVSYSVRWANDNPIGVGDLELAVEFPEEFRPDARTGMTVSGNTATIAIGDIGKRSRGEESISGKFYGSRGSLLRLRAIARFTPIGISGRYETDSHVGVTIVSSPLSFDFVTPRKIAPGSEAPYVISYRNDGDIEFRNLQVRVSYPDAFHLDSAVPSPIGSDPVWGIGTLAPGGTGEIRILGTLEGDGERSASVIAEVGVPQGDGSLLVLERIERLTTIVVPPLSITQTVSGKKTLVAHPGDRLDYRFDYANTGDIGLRDVIVSVEVDPELLDMSSFSFGASGGSYDANTRMATWKASDVPDFASLGPGRKGTVGFTVSIRNDIGSGADLIVRTVARIDSPDVPFSVGADKIVASDALDVRIGAEASLSASASFDDPVLPGYGPMPPKVGQATGYAMRLRVTNSFNELVRATVTMTVPTGVRYMGKKMPESASVDYNERTGKLVWNIGTIEGGGSAVRELVIAVELVPGPDLEGKQATLLRDMTLEGTDAFTDEPISVDFGRLTADIRDASGMSLGTGIIVP